jgi:general stress protein YciG
MGCSKLAILLHSLNLLNSLSHRLYHFIIRQQRFGISRRSDKGERVAKAGGEARAQDKEGLSEAGRKGGETVSQDKKHMSEIGKKGGQK